MAPTFRPLSAMVTPFRPISAVPNKFRKWQYEQYFFWLGWAAVALVGMILFALKDHLLTGVAVAATLYALYSMAKICLNGRWWPLEGLTLRLMRWTGRALLQVGGIMFAVVIGILVTRAELSAWIVLAYTVYAFSISRFQMFRVTFDFTTAWICTTASTAWGMVVLWDDEGKFVGLNLVDALGISCILVLLIYTGKYLDEYRPATNKLYDKGRAGHCGYQKRPKNSDPPPGFIQPSADGAAGSLKLQSPRDASVSELDRAIINTMLDLPSSSSGLVDVERAMEGESSSSGLADDERDGILARRSGGDDFKSRSIDFTISVLEFLGLKDKKESRSHSM